MAKKKAAKKAAKTASAPKARPAAKKTAKPRAAAKSKTTVKPKAAVKRKAAKKAAPAKPKAAPKKSTRKTAKRMPPSGERLQAEAYAKAVETFQAGKLKRALALFETVAEGPDAGLRHRANVHIQICRRRTQSDTVELKTADDYYNYAVKLINDRRLDEAETHLDKALKKAARAGYVHYAKALIAALRKNGDDSYRSLSRAIELDPKHRLQARRDPDMAAVREDERIAELLQGDAAAGDPQ